MKRLITCTDGTWDKPGDKIDGKSLDSNVCLIYNAIPETAPDGTPQLKVYDTGVGSGYSLKDKLMGGISGEGIDKKIKDVYTFLILNYEKGDDIYLFGFSRGAYTARSLAGFIRNCGILKPEYLHLLDQAYSLYRDRNDYTTPDSDMMVSFRRNYCFENITRIKFIGVWDTVGSLGIPFPWFNLYDKERYKFHDVTLSSTIDYAYHALAVDERRKLFKPTLWQASTNKQHGGTIALEQRWFAGVHCNVGGGYEERGLSNQTLQWMAEKAESTGLFLDRDRLKEFVPNPMGVLRNSYTFLYWFLGKIWREVDKLEYSNQFINETVYDRMRKDSSYRPENIHQEKPENIEFNTKSYDQSSNLKPESNVLTQVETEIKPTYQSSNQTLKEMISITEARTGVKALFLQAAGLSGYSVSTDSPERLADIMEKGYYNVDDARRAEAVANILKLIAASLEAAQNNGVTHLNESTIAAGQDKICPVYPFD